MTTPALIASGVLIGAGITLVGAMRCATAGTPAFVSDGTAAALPSRPRGRDHHL